MHRQQHVAFLLGVNVMLDAGRKHKNVSGSDCMLLIGGANSKATFEHMDADGALRNMLRHRRPTGEMEQRNRGVPIANQRLLPMSLRRRGRLARQVSGSSAKIDQLLRRGEPFSRMRSKTLGITGT